MITKSKIGIIKLIIFLLTINIFLPIILINANATSNTDISYDLIISENGNVSSIQKAIDESSPSDVIFIKNGTYTENIVIDKAIHLIGENKNSTVVDGRNTGNVFKINAQYVTIEQITIQNSGNIFPNSGINLSASHATIKNNIIKNNFYGMTLYNADHNLIENNQIKNDDHCGIYMSESKSNTIQNNTVTNHTYNGFGVYDSSNNNLIKNNNLTYNMYCGINLRISSNNTITKNIISNNNIGIHIPSEENIIKNNTFSNNNIKFDEESIIPKVPGFELLVVMLSLLILFAYVRYNKT
jgi:parallel beta-helix repeat protein